MCVGLSLFILIFMAGCPCDQGWILFLDEDDSGTLVAGDVGGRLYLSLSGNASTGAVWEVTELDEAILAHTGSTTQRHCMMSGCPETKTWEFTALSPGTTTLRMIYHRPWEEAEPDRTFELTVVVQEP
jgi:predicted secreted protein